ncbi:TPA: hypothetical protein HNC86_20335 [Escherichia coli]|nr:hypothetical protein [Escherichia coli]
MIRLIFSFLLCTLCAGCLSQPFYSCSIVMVNTCKVSINISTVNNSTHYDGKARDNFHLDIGERKPIVYFIYTGRESDVFNKNPVNIVSELSILISDGNNSKTLSGYHISSLLKKSSSSMESDFSFEINDPSICP